MQKWTPSIRGQLNDLPGFPARPNTNPPADDRWELGEWIDETRVRPGVADVASLPATGNEPGDVRVVDFDQSWYYWNGLAWVPMGSGGAGPILAVTGVAPINVTAGPNPIVSHDASGAVAGTYGDASNVAQVTVDAKGHVTAATTVPIAFPSSTPPSGPAGGDLTGTYPNPTLTTTGVSAATYGNATNVAQVAVDAKGRVTSASNVSIAFPAPPTSLPPNGPAGGDLTGTYPNPTLTTTGVAAGTYGNATNVAQVAVDAKGRVTSASNVSIAFPAPPTSLPPNGPAGGDLTGTYPNPTLTTTGVAAGTYGAGDTVPVITVDVKGRLTNVTTASNFTAHEGYDTLVHDLAESNYQEVSYAAGLVTAIVYWTTPAKILKIREALFTYNPDDTVNVVTERQYNGAGVQTQQLVHSYAYNPDETLASITTVRT